jgi:hypothetical protein
MDAQPRLEYLLDCVKGTRNLQILFEVYQIIRQQPGKPPYTFNGNFMSIDLEALDEEILINLVNLFRALEQVKRNPDPKSSVQFFAGDGGRAAMANQNGPPSVVDVGDLPEPYREPRNFFADERDNPKGLEFYQPDSSDEEENEEEDDCGDDEVAAVQGSFAEDWEDEGPSEDYEERQDDKDMVDYYEEDEEDGEDEDL